MGGVEDEEDDLLALADFADVDGVGATLDAGGAGLRLEEEEGEPGSEGGADEDLRFADAREEETAEGAGVGAAMGDVVDEVESESSDSVA